MISDPVLPLLTTRSRTSSSTSRPGGGRCATSRTSLRGSSTSSRSTPSTTQQSHSSARRCGLSSGRDGHGRLADVTLAFSRPASPARASRRPHVRLRSIRFSSSTGRPSPRRSFLCRPCQTPISGLRAPRAGSAGRATTRARREASSPSSTVRLNRRLKLPLYSLTSA